MSNLTYIFVDFPESGINKKVRNYLIFVFNLINMY